MLLDISLHYADLLLCLVGLGLQILLEFLVLILVLLESFAALIQLLLLHDDVLLQQLSLLSLVIDRDLGHQDLPTVLNEFADCLFLLSGLVHIVNRFQTNRVLGAAAR